MKDRDKPNNRQGAVYKMLLLPGFLHVHWWDWQKPQQKTDWSKQATRNGDASNHIAVHHQLTNHNTDWDSAQCLTYSTNYFQRVTLKSWYTNLEQMHLNRCQQLPVPYKRLIKDSDKRTSYRPTYITIHGSKPTNLANTRWIDTRQWLMTNFIPVFQPIPSWLNWPITFNGPDL